MSNEAAPVADAPKEGESGTPPTPAPATPSGNESEMVTLSKEEVDQLKRDAARAASNQRKADLYDRTAGRAKESHFKYQPPATPPTDEEKEQVAREEDRKAERGLVALVADPAYRELFDADPTLRSLLTQNPLSILPIYAPDALDAEDAIMLVKEKLTARVAEIKSKLHVKPPVSPPPIMPATPPAGGVNPPGATTPDAEYEAARKETNTESAIAGMVKVGLSRMGGK